MAEIEGMHPGLPDAILLDVQAKGRLPETLANSIDSRIQLLMSANLSRSKRHSTLTEVCDNFREIIFFVNLLPDTTIITLPVPSQLIHLAVKYRPTNFKGMLIFALYV